MVLTIAHWASMPSINNNSNRPVIGISAVVCGLFLFSLQDVVIKFFSNDYSVLQIVVIRGVVATSIVAIAVAMSLGPTGFIVRNPMLILSKGLLAFISYLAYYMAIASLPLANVVAITFSAPIMVTVMSALLLRENVGVRQWFAVAIGFTGVLLVVGPGGRIADIAVSFAAIAALTYSINSIIARYIGPEDKPLTVTFYFTLAHFIGGVMTSILIITIGPMIQAEHPSLAFLIRPWSMENDLDLLVMVALGVNAALGFYCLNKAYLSAPASTVAPFEYTYILWAVLFGYIFWSEIPSLYTLAGVMLLISGNLYILHRVLLDKRNQRKQQRRRCVNGVIDDARHDVELTGKQEPQRVWHTGQESAHQTVYTTGT